MKTFYMIRELHVVADLLPPHELTPGWCISRINVPAEHRGKKHGSRMLATILRDADREGVTLWLEPVPSGPLDYQALVNWYKRYGFRFHQTGYMLRRPRKKKTS